MPIGTVVNEEIPQEERQPGPLRQRNNLAESSNDESSDDKGDGTIRKICKIPWLEMTEKCGYWVQSEIWDEYICLKGYEKRDISTTDNFFVVFVLVFFCSFVNIKVRFPFHCPFGRLFMP